MEYLNRTYGTADDGGVRFYNLDNEPDLWSSTHRDVHPEGTGYDEIRDSTTPPPPPSRTPTPGRRPSARSAGNAADPLDILKGAGVNYVRLRLWNNPASGYNNKAKVLAYARAVKAKGLKLLVDFHYSDTWADPGNQRKPAAWASHGIGALQTDVYNYTYDVCTSLKAQGTAPDSVQLGNEINVGMLWNDGKVVNN
ncbi:hypothetical protein SANTM175S_01473 [Streptomyces antimycoticus]